MLPTLALITSALAAPGLNGTPNTPQPAPAITPSVPQGIQWVFDFGEAQAKSKAASRPLLVYFWADGSAKSVEFFSKTLADEQVIEALNSGYVCCSAKTNDQAGYDLAKKFNIQALPSMLVLTSQGDTEDLLAGFLSQKELMTQLDRVGRGHKTLSWFKARAAKNPEDLQARFDLAIQLDHVGDRERHDEILESIRKDDPEGKTEIGCRLRLQDLQGEIMAGVSDAKDADFGPIYAFIEKCKHRKLAFDAWNQLANMEWSRGDKLKCRQNMMKAWEIIPEDEIMDWGNNMAFKAWEQREDIPNQVRKLALKIAGEATKRAENFYKKGGISDKPKDGDGNEKPDGNKGEESGDKKSKEELDKFLAGRLDTLAVCYHMNGNKALAMKTIKRCIKLDPKEKAYRERLSYFQKNAR